MTVPSHEMPSPPEAFILALASAMWNPDDPDLAAARMAPVLSWSSEQSAKWISAHWEPLQQILEEGVDEHLLDAAEQCSRKDVAEFARSFDALGMHLTELSDDDPGAVDALIARHGIDPAVAPWLFDSVSPED